MNNAIQKSIGLRPEQYDYLEKTRNLLKSRGIDILFEGKEKPKIRYLSQGEVLLIGCMMINQKIDEVDKK